MYLLNIIPFETGECADLDRCPVALRRGVPIDYCFTANRQAALSKVSFGSNPAVASPRAALPPLRVDSNGLPAFQRCVLDPQGEAAPSARARLVGRPVPHLERHLRATEHAKEGVVAAIGVVFMGHWAIRARKG